jgi:hypothetical protein
MERRHFLSSAAAAAAAGFTAGMTATQKADAIEARAAADLEAAMARQAGRTRVRPLLCHVGEQGPFGWEGKSPYLQGDDPKLPPMPQRPGILDFFTQRVNVSPVGSSHLVQSATLALKAGLPEKTVVACLLHDFGMLLIRADHGYWAADLIGPYVAPEISWAVRYHQALRFFPDESVGYRYPESYVRYFGADYQPEPYIVADANYARKHRWYMTARMICVNDLYAFDPNAVVSFDPFVDLLGRHFRNPREGLGFDGHRVAHMWRTLIWPNNFL